MPTFIRELLTFYRLFTSLQAYFGECYCITIPLVLIVFGGTLPQQNIWGNGITPHFPSTTPLTVTDVIGYSPVACGVPCAFRGESKPLMWLC